ncbi:DUF3551 domain-containing protein [Bradyrhizobium erythrophlei]|uniref:DUF3551 domain-containing protein n=1 Tax=Bradyrhizobium erythrophlei TaxID=1437360 RepID=UPI0009A6116E|nr:DUF3551 domain-containing protein [Bradyrhizobium erythrophlei]
MRWHLLALAALASATLAPGATPPARAETYPVCLDGGFDSGSLHCDFSTIEQCRATASGIGGSCGPNPEYQPPSPAIRNGPARRRHH